MKKMSGDELAKEIGCDASTLKKTCMLTLSLMEIWADEQSTTTITTPRTQDQTLSTRR